MNDLHWILNSFAEFDDLIALEKGQIKTSYSELKSNIESILKLLSKNNVADTSVVSVLGDYSANSIAMLISLAIKKCIIVPISTTVDSEIEIRQTIAGVEHQVSWDQSGSMQIQKIDVKSSKISESYKHFHDQGHSGLVLFSSGVSGKPKAMIQDFTNLVNAFQGKKPRRLTLLAVLLFDHIGGLNTLLNAITTGNHCILPEERTADHCAKLIQDKKVRFLPCSPTFLNLFFLANSFSEFDFSSLRIVSYGTEPMPESLLQRLKNNLPKVRFLQTFGTSETGISQTQSKSSTSTFFKFQDPNLEYKVVDGVLWLKSKTQVLGYLNANNEKFTKDGWFITGDMVETSEDGYIRIIGRKSDVINVGGEKVLPQQVENILMQIDEIVDCSVYGVKNSITGQSVSTDVILKDSLSPQEIKRIIRKHCKGKLDKYMIPAKVRVVESLKSNSRFKKLR